MKLSHNIIVFDLEMTMRINMSGTTVNDAIIEIGAVALNKDLEIVGEYSQLVIPLVPLGGGSNEKWRAQIGPAEAITGITEDEIANYGVEFPKAYAGLTELAEKVGGLKKCRLAAWGNYFDINMVRRECDRWKIPFGFSGTCYDVKTIAWMYQTLAGKRTDSGLTVAEMSNTFGIKLEGAHRAVNDARATAHVLVKCLKSLDGAAFIELESKKKLVKITV